MQTKVMIVAYSKTKIMEAVECNYVSCTMYGENEMIATIQGGEYNSQRIKCDRVLTVECYDPKDFEGYFWSKHERVKDGELIEQIKLDL